MEIFPQFMAALTTVQEKQLPLLKECKWDFGNNRAVFAHGVPVIVSGHEAVLVWAYHALLTVRGRWEIHTAKYGSDLEALIGSSWSGDLVRAEAMQYVRECLLASPYITAITGLTVTFENTMLRILCTIQSIYGESEERYDVSL